MPKFGSTPILWTHITHAKISTHATHTIFLTHATLAKISTHATHAKILQTHPTHAKVWPMPPMNPRTHAPTNPRHPRYLARLDFEALLRKNNDISYYYRNIHLLMIELYKIKNELAPPITDSMGRNITYNFTNLQGFQSERKRTVFNSLETLSFHAAQLWTLLPEDIKQRIAINLFKSDVKQWICKECPCRLRKVFVLNRGFFWHMAPILVLFKLFVCVCVFVCLFVVFFC